MSEEKTRGSASFVTMDMGTGKNLEQGLAQQSHSAQDFLKNKSFGEDEFERLDDNMEVGDSKSGEFTSKGTIEKGIIQGAREAMSKIGGDHISRAMLGAASGVVPGAVVGGVTADPEDRVGGAIRGAMFGGAGGAVGGLASRLGTGSRTSKYLKGEAGNLKSHMKRETNRIPVAGALGGVAAETLIDKGIGDKLMNLPAIVYPAAATAAVAGAALYGANRLRKKKDPNTVNPPQAPEIKELSDDMVVEKSAPGYGKILSNDPRSVRAEEAEMKLQRANADKENLKREYGERKTTTPKVEHSMPKIEPPLIDKDRLLRETGAKFNKLKRNTKIVAAIGVPLAAAGMVGSYLAGKKRSTLKVEDKSIETVPPVTNTNPPSSFNDSKPDLPETNVPQSFASGEPIVQKKEFQNLGDDIEEIRNKKTVKKGVPGLGKVTGSVIEKVTGVGKGRLAKIGNTLDKEGVTALRHKSSGDDSEPVKKGIISDIAEHLRPIGNLADDVVQVGVRKIRPKKDEVPENKQKTKGIEVKGFDDNIEVKLGPLGAIGGAGIGYLRGRAQTDIEEDKHAAGKRGALYGAIGGSIDPTLGVAAGLIGGGMGGRKVRDEKNTTALRKKLSELQTKADEPKTEKSLGSHLLAGGAGTAAGMLLMRPKVDNEANKPEKIREMERLQKQGMPSNMKNVPFKQIPVAKMKPLKEKK
jgi:hypothetical protein